MARRGHFFWKKCTKNFTSPYSIPFLSVLHQNKALHNFHKRGTHEKSRVRLDVVRIHCYMWLFFLVLIIRPWKLKFKIWKWLLKNYDGNCLRYSPFGEMFILKTLFLSYWFQAGSHRKAMKQPETDSVWKIRLVDTVEWIITLHWDFF